jgi:hypothetical protein
LVRTSSPILITSLLALACTEAPDPSSAPPAPAPSSPTVTPAPSPEPAVAIAAAVASIEAPVVADPELESPTPSTAGETGEGALESAEPGLADPRPEAIDPLAPILPSGPEPGSPESDAELAELLEESTLTQDEFDAAFRGSKPKIDGDQFVFGPGDRTRKSPVVELGTPTVSGAKLTASELSSLAKADLRGFESCLAVALSDDSTIHGAPSLRVVFDAKGKASKVTVEGGASLGVPLRECLVAVADGWTLPAAAGATGVVPLTLSSE